MVNRQKIYICLAISAGVCTGVGVYLLYRHQQKSAINRPVAPTSIPPSLRQHQDYQNFDRNSSSEFDNDENEFLQISNEIKIPDGGVPLTPDQASILTHFLYESYKDEEKLHQVLTSITNASTFKESQINLTNAGCINRLRELLLKLDNDLTKCKILLALNNLALNDFAITQFTNMIPIVIDICRTSATNSHVRLYGLNLLINMSVLEYLHEEYMNHIYELGLLIESTIESEDEALSAGKILVNLSTNTTNLESLLKLTGVELKTVINLFTSNTDPSSKSEDILLRYLIFYCNLADTIIYELNESEDTNNNHYPWFNDPTPQRQGAVYFEFFDQDKQKLAKSLLRPHSISNKINSQMKRLYQSMDKIRQSQIHSSVENYPVESTNANSHFSE